MPLRVLRVVVIVLCAAGITGMIVASVAGNNNGWVVTFGLLTAVSGTCALLGIVAVGAHSDRTGERRWYVAGAAFLIAAAVTALTVERTA